MTASRHQLGKFGEQLAVDHLKRQGYDILTTNWRCEHGEIDIVSQKNATLIFVEVRTRRGNTTETAFESIDRRKRDRLITLAQAYLSEQEQEEEDPIWRIDVIAIAVPSTGKPVVEHVEDALSW